MGRRRIAAVSAAACLLAVVLGTSSRASATALPVKYSVTASASYLLQPNKSPAGSNDWSCRPSASHPRPVVLVEGTIATMGENWSVLSPLLKNKGYCVFALNYGATWVSTVTLGNVQALGPIDKSAAQLGDFITAVLAATGASKVDLVGHSQGGMMPNYYLKFLGGAPKVHALVGLSPSNHGTTLGGIVRLGATLSTIWPALLPSINTAIGLGGGQSFVDQEVGSAFMKKMATKPDTVAGVAYTVIQTKYDQIVTPYTNAFLSGSNVRNITLQDQCPADHADHAAVAFDHIALGEVLNALDPAHAVRPVCSTVLPLLGG